MKAVSLLTAILMISAPLFAKDLEGISLSSDFVPQPVLLSPTRGEAVLTGKDVLEFKWSPHEGVSGSRDYYDFRLYKGYNMVEEAVIVKVKLPGDAYQFNVSSDRFEDGLTYTWSLSQAYSEGRKSKGTFASFKVIKK